MTKCKAASIAFSQKQEEDKEELATAPLHIRNIK
jgi:hypothetical protein